MLIWNIGTTWWIWNSTGPGAAAAILANSLLMCMPWLGFHWIRTRMGNVFGYFSLILFWLSFEYFHLQNWGLSWPWLTLGNIFASHPGLVLWYQFTGTSGGSLWILVVNVLLFQWLWQLVKHRSFSRQALITAIALVILPVLLSWITRSDDKTKPPDYNIVIVQPNIDPYEKVVAGTFESQLQKLIRLSESAIDTNTALVVWPETALFIENGGIEEDHMRDNHSSCTLSGTFSAAIHASISSPAWKASEFFNDRHSPTAFFAMATNMWKAIMPPPSSTPAAS